jgi:DNA-binding NarL/FixJ family response regulator
MARFSNKSGALLKSLSAELGTISTGGPPFFETLLPQLRELLGLDVTMFYDLRKAEKGFNVDRLAGDQLTVSTQQVVTAFDALLSASAGRWGVFEPTRPEPQQRNLSQVHPPLALSSTKTTAPAWLNTYGLSSEEKTNYVTAGLERMSLLYRQMEVHGLWQLRVLVCEQDSMLAWVGGFSEEEPGDDARRLLNSLVPALRRRLVLERTLDRGPMVDATIAATMEAIPGSAFLASANGHILQANAAAKSQLDREPAATGRSIVEALRKGAGRDLFDVTPVTAAGRKPIYLLVGRMPASLEARLAICSGRWELTKRQAQVLALVVRGDANRTIAARLNCGDRAIELHVAALLVRAGVESRSALIAKFFMDSSLGAG